MLTKPLFRSLLAAAAAVALIVPGFSHSTEAQNTTSGDGGHIGIFHILYGQAHLEYGKTRDYAVLTAPGDKLVQVTTNLYDAFARRIEITLAQSAGRTKPTEMIATGAVRMVVREAESGRTTVVTCDKAVYTSTGSKDDRGKLHLTGNVRSETQDKLLAQPLVSVSDSELITFMPDGTMVAELDNPSGQGSISGQPYEPAPKGKSKP